MVGITHLTINISADTVAWYGAILATFAAMKTIYDWWNDLTRVEIKWQFDMLMSGENDTFFVVNVINKGRRPVKITHVAVKLYGMKEIALLGHSFTNPEQRVLTDEKPSTTYPTVQGDISSQSLWYVVVYDARGREHRRYNPVSTPFLRRCWYRLTKPAQNKRVNR